MLPRESGSREALILGCRLLNEDFLRGDDRFAEVTGSLTCFERQRADIVDIMLQYPDPKTCPAEDKEKVMDVVYIIDFHLIMRERGYDYSSFSDRVKALRETVALAEVFAEPWREYIRFGNPNLFHQAPKLSGQSEKVEDSARAHCSNKSCYATTNKIDGGRLKKCSKCEFC